MTHVTFLPFVAIESKRTCEASADRTCHRYFLFETLELNISELVELKNRWFRPLENIQVILQDGFNCSLLCLSLAFCRILIKYMPSVSSLIHWSLVCYREYEAVRI